MAEENSWRTQNFRQSVVAKIDEAIQKSGMPTSKNSIEMESHVFQKAKSKEEYLGFVARLILHVREMNAKKGTPGISPGPGQAGGQGMPDPIGALQTLARQGTGNAQMMGMAGPGPNPQGMVPQPPSNTAANLLQSLNQRPGPAMNMQGMQNKIPGIGMMPGHGQGNGPMGHMGPMQGMQGGPMMQQMNQMSQGNMPQQMNQMGPGQMGQMGPGQIAPGQMQQNMQKAYGDYALPRTALYEWFSTFWDDSESLENDEHSERPSTSRTEETVEKIGELITNDRCMSVRLIEDITGISRSQIYRILTEDLKLRKVCARFVPNTLDGNQKHVRVLHAQDIVSTADNDPNFLKTIVTGDETWCFQYEPLAKRQNSVWKSPEEPTPKKVRVQESKVKTMLITFFDSNGIIHKEFVRVGETVNGEYYLGVMKRLLATIDRVRPQYQAQGSWSLLHDNAPAHRCIAVRKFLASKSVQILDHPPYSPDLAPCDYFLFPKLKMKLKEKRCNTISDIQNASIEAIATIPKEDYQRCFQKLYDRCKNCIYADGMYFEF